MPMEGTHTARQFSPDECAQIRQKDITDGVSANICIPKSGKASKIQSIHFDAKKFSVEEAKKWLKAHDFSDKEFEPATGKGKAAAVPVLVAAVVNADAPVMKDVSKCPMGADCPLQKGEATACVTPQVRAVNLAAEGLPSLLRIDAVAGALELQAAAAGAPGRRALAATLYTGASMRLEGYTHPVVIDLAGMKVPNQRMALLRQHDPNRIVGYAEAVEITAQRMRLSGFLSSATPAGQEVLALADDGFSWQMSVGADVNKMEFIDKGASAKANGRNFDGPHYIARATSAREGSLVPIGADPGTSAAVASAATPPDTAGQKEEPPVVVEGKSD